MSQPKRRGTGSACSRNFLCADDTNVISENPYIVVFFSRYASVTSTQPFPEEMAA